MFANLTLEQAQAELNSLRRSAAAQRSGKAYRDTMALMGKVEARIAELRK